MRHLTQALADWIAGGGREAGEMHIEPAASGFVLYHRADASRGDLIEYLGAEAARDLAHFDDAGKFRPLKTAPTLRHGWKLCLASLSELRRALDYFYPAMLGVWLSHQRGCLSPVRLRETLARQTGMYAVTKKIADDLAEETVENFCAGCLKRRLWTLTGAADIEPFTMAPSLPLLCHEACNLLVAKVREVVKKSEVSA